jgi:TonB family protein
MKYVDTVGNVLADNGNGKWVDFDGDFVSKKEGPVINGKREGDWVETAATGKKRNGTFKNGILVSGPLLTDDDNTYGKVDVPPSFVGGEQAFSKFLSRTLKYPQVAKDENIQGLVVITFVVEKDGTLTNINVLRAPHVSMAKEATRVLALSPAWKPGIQNGKPVRVQYSLPITFGLEVSTFIPGKSSDGYSSDDRY